MRYRSGLLLPGETVELRGPATHGLTSRRVGEVVAVERQGIRLRQTLRDFAGPEGATANLMVRVRDGDRWVRAGEYRDDRPQTVVVFWRNVAAVEVLEASERAA